MPPTKLTGNSNNMKLEFLESGSADCPLIRIYGTSAADFAQLREAAQTLANGEAASVAIDQLPGLKAIDNCSLLFAVGASHASVKPIRKLKNAFAFTLTQPDWEVIADLIEPFTKSPVGSYHQWLCGKEAGGLLGKSTISNVISSHEAGSW